MTQSFAEEEKVPAKVPDHAMDWGPSKAIIELLGSRLATNELFESHNVEHEVVQDEAIALGQQRENAMIASEKDMEANLESYIDRLYVFHPITGRRR